MFRRLSVGSTSRSSQAQKKSTNKQIHNKMPQYFTNQDGNSILLENTPFATAGGEGTIYKVIGSHQKQVAKIYHTPEMAASRREKILYMYANNPVASDADEIKKAIIWVEEVLYKEGRFVGFVMTKVKNAISLKALTLARNPSKKFGDKWRKFDHDYVGSHQKRLIIAYNLSQAVNAIHKQERYVIVDLKPENVFVREDASVAIIDLDSIQINTGEKVFAATVFTEEYAPPEKHKGQIELSKGNVESDWDHFSLAVIIYELLFGIHPFQASHIIHTTRPELIKGGFFVHGQNQKLLLKIPDIHKNFGKLSVEVRSLFFDTFEEGNIESQSRARPAQWTEVLLPQINDLSVYQTQLDFSDLVPVSKKTKPKEVKWGKLEGKVLSPQSPQPSKTTNYKWYGKKKVGKSAKATTLILFLSLSPLIFQFGGALSEDFFTNDDYVPPSVRMTPLEPRYIKLEMKVQEVIEIQFHPSGEMQRDKSNELVYFYEDNEVHFYKSKIGNHNEFRVKGFKNFNDNRKLRLKKPIGKDEFDGTKIQIGYDLEQVKEVQGKPTREFLDKRPDWFLTYYYGESEVHFNSENKVVSYIQEGELKL